MGDAVRAGVPGFVVPKGPWLSVQLPKCPLALCSRAGHRANKLPFTHGAGASPEHAQMIITSLGCGAWTRAERLEGELVNGEILIYAKTMSSPWLVSEVGRELPPPKEDPKASGRPRPRAQFPRTLATSDCASPLRPAPRLRLRETAPLAEACLRS